MNKSQISLKQRPVLFGAAPLLTAEGHFSATFYSLTVCVCVCVCVCVLQFAVQSRSKRRWMVAE